MRPSLGPSLGPAPLSNILKRKVMLHPWPSPASRSAPQILPSSSPKEDPPLLGNSPTGSLSASPLIILKIGLR